MATTVEIHRWCDIHLAEKDEQVPGEQYTLTMAMNGGRPQTLTVDLCADCTGPLEGAQELLSAYGRKPQDGAAQGTTRSKRAKPTKASAEAQPDADAAAAGLVCPECGHTSTSRKGLAHHARNMHGKPLAELEGFLQGLTCVVCQPPQTFPSLRSATIHVGRGDHSTA